MSGYAKLFSSILDSTVWRLGAADRLVWITMLAMADRDGIVEASVPGLADRARVSRVECERALALLSAPDPDSRSPDLEGRRVVAVRGGWQLTNYEFYRDRQSAEEMREKAAARQRRKRERATATAEHTESHAVTPGHAMSRPSRDVTSVTLSSPSPSPSQQHLISAADQEADRERDSEGGVAQRHTAPSRPAAGVVGPSADGRRRKPAAPRKDPLAHQIASAATWEAYSLAYRARYSTDPTRNARVNGQVAHFLARVPAAEAPEIAAHYVRSQNARYVAAGHAWGPLLQDAEAVRTEWLTGRARTAHAARQADRRAGRGAEYEEVIARLEAEDRARLGGLS